MLNPFTYIDISSQKLYNYKQNHYNIKSTIEQHHFFVFYNESGSKSLKIAGIVAEYNPFHTGHLHHIEKTRNLLGRETAIVCVMSGNFTQRGDFAIYEKHARAEAAVLCGADLVLELPVPWALSSAEGFAYGSVSILNSLGIITHLSFGSESGSVRPLTAAADFLLSGCCDELIRSELQKGVSFAEARQNAAAKVLGEDAKVLGSPNNILGVEYIKALKLLNSAIKPLTFLRAGAGHDSDELAQTASASKIRGMIKNGEDTLKYIPGAAAEVFARETASGRAPVFTENCENAILAALRRMSGPELCAFDGGAEGLGDRLYKIASVEPRLTSVYEKTKTKRYALSRIRRLVTRAYIGIPPDLPKAPPYAKILALGGRGRLLLKNASKDYMLISKPASGKALTGDAKRIFELDALSTDLYVLAYPKAAERYGGQEYTLGPKIILFGVDKACMQ